MFIKEEKSFPYSIEARTYGTVIKISEIAINNRTDTANPGLSYMKPEANLS